jgi:release factor glutamine methyltransferase
MSDDLNQGWTIQKLLTWTTQHFASKNISSARLDAELLLSHMLGCKRLDLYLRFDQPLGAAELARFKEFVIRRAKNEPVAYILGSKEFYGREFKVGPGALIPRPETEHLIDEVLNWAKAQRASDEPAPLKILEVGAGSGCIAATLAKELPQAKVLALEKSEEAFLWAKLNVEAHQVGGQVEVVHQDFDRFRTDAKFDVIVSNPPYVGENTKHHLAPDVRDFEPPAALYGGEVGYELLRRWIPVWCGLLGPKGLLVIEIGFDQGPIVNKILDDQQELESVKIINDYAGHSRIARAIKRKPE